MARTDNHDSTFSSLPVDLQFAFIHFMRFAEVHGRQACKRYGVGFMREDIGREDPAPVVPINPAAARDKNVVSIVVGQRIRRAKMLAKLARSGIPIDTSRDFNETPEGKSIKEWRKALAAICDECGACKWSGRPA